MKSARDVFSQTKFSKDIFNSDICYRYDYSGIQISRTSKGNANWFEKSGVREIDGGIKLRLIGRVLFGYE